MSHERIRTMADEGRFSKQIAEQLITAGCPAGLAWRTFTVADGRGLSIAAAFAFVKNETAPTARQSLGRQSGQRLSGSKAASPRPPDTWDAAIAAVNAEFGIKIAPAK